MLVAAIAVASAAKGVVVAVVDAASAVVAISVVVAESSSAIAVDVVAELAVAASIWESKDSLMSVVSVVSVVVSLVSVSLLIVLALPVESVSGVIELLIERSTSFCRAVVNTLPEKLVEVMFIASGVDAPRCRPYSV